MGSQYAQALLEVATDAVIVIDHRGIIETTNAATERLFGYSPAALVGRNVSLLMPASEAERHDGYLKRYIETGVAHVIGRGREVEAQRSDGSRFPAALSVGRVAGTDPPCFVGFVHDLTQYRQALASVQADRDRAREHEAEALRFQARQIAVSRMATVGEMAAGIAHEINQPLTAISNYARACQRFAAQQPPDLADLQECMNEIANETQRAADFLRDLRRFVGSQLEKSSVCDLNDIVRQSRSLVLAEARMHQATVQFEFAAGLPQVSVEAAQIQQMLLNLTRNALEAMDSHAAGKSEIRITTGIAADGDVELAVMDNGPGVDPNIAREMFEPLFSTKPSGAGLGLAISRTIAHKHGGQLLFWPADTGGACFALRLPPHVEPAT